MRARPRPDSLREERGRDLVDAHVGALRRQDRRDEQFERRREVQFGCRVRMLAIEGVEDRGGAFTLGGRRGSGLSETAAPPGA